jgi:hypothetical protein
LLFVTSKVNGCCSDGMSKEGEEQLQDALASAAAACSRGRVAGNCNVYVVPNRQAAYSQKVHVSVCTCNETSLAYASSR